MTVPETHNFAETDQRDGDAASPTSAAAAPAGPEVEQTPKRSHVALTNKQMAQAWRRQQERAAEASRAAIKRKKASGLVQLSTWVPEELHSPIKQLIATMMNSYRAAQMAAEAEKQVVSPIVQEFQSLGRKITFQASTRTERLTMTFGEVDENEDEHRFSPSNDSFDGLSMEDMAELMADYARNK